MNPAELLNQVVADKKVVIFGTGEGSIKVGLIFPNHSYYVDNNTSKHGQLINGFRVQSPKVLLNEDKNRLLIIVASSFYSEISIQLESYGLIEGVHFWDGLKPYRFLYYDKFKDGLTVNGILFSGFRTNAFGTHSVGFHTKYIIKIEHDRLNLKSNSLSDEIITIQSLNELKCVTCPKMLSEGVLETGERFYIQQRIYSKGRPSTADLLFTLIEQKNLGVFHGDLKPDNIIFDGEVCHLIDYDQSVRSSELKSMSNKQFLEYVVTHSLEKYGEDRLERYENFFDKEEMQFLLRNDSFNMAKTTLFQHQMTTQEIDGIYHNLFTDSIHIKGARDFTIRKKLLDDIPFSVGEKVLDVGCNMGLLSHYLFDRECNVTGIDLDSSIVKIAQMVSNITGKQIVFENKDIDNAIFEHHYDTICFFSVLQHVENLTAMGEKIAEKCNRIIIENRLCESGTKPINGSWQKTTSWYFENIEQLQTHFEMVFPGFKFKKCYGKADRRRYVLEFVKTLDGGCLQ